MQEQFLITYTGKKFHFLDPQPEEVDIVDIAHHLSLLCRFTGAVSQFYSVAEHSIRVSDELPDELKFAGLMHDAAEAYINDISRPVKYTHRLQLVEEVIKDVIDRKFEILSSVTAHEIKDMDDKLLLTEARDLMPASFVWIGQKEGVKPLTDKIIPWQPRYTESLFLNIFSRYRRIE